jgi:hypothetical protein
VCANNVDTFLAILARFQLTATEVAEAYFGYCPK